jgi:hypothetical protein
MRHSLASAWWPEIGTFVWIMSMRILFSGFDANYSIRTSNRKGPHGDRYQFQAVRNVELADRNSWHVETIGHFVMVRVLEFPVMKRTTSSNCCFDPIMIPQTTTALERASEATSGMLS